MSTMAEITQAVLVALNGGAPVVTATVVQCDADTGVRPGDKLLVRADGSTLGRFDNDALQRAVVDLALAAIPRHATETLRLTADGARVPDRHTAAALDVLIEVVESPARLLIVGGGHIGRALCTLGALTGFSVTVLDDRPEYANRERFPEADHVICADFTETLAEMPVDGTTYAVLVTRGHKQDELSLRALVNRPAAYLGMIGSKRRTGAVIQHLLDDGFPRDALDRVHTPIGLEIGAETPEEIAVSIIAEVIMTRRGGAGRPMYYRRTEVLTAEC